jgi:hypothetical protein
VAQGVGLEFKPQCSKLVRTYWVSITLFHFLNFLNFVSCL